MPWQRCHCCETERDTDEQNGSSKEHLSFNDKVTNWVDLQQYTIKIQNSVKVTEDA